MKSILTTVAILVVTGAACAQVPYGNNPAAGSYFNTGDANIYYEVYGSGKPLVLLHGGIFGYVTDFESLIAELSKNYKVIAIATRGHGKSELGKQPLSYKLFSEDAYKVIRHLTADSAIVIGFSDGADQAYYLAADHPDAVKRLVAIGGNFGAADYSDMTFINGLSAGLLIKNYPYIFNPRKQIMPDSSRFAEFVSKMAVIWKNDVYVSKETISSIQCPTLIAFGEGDGCPTEQYVKLYRLLKKGHLAVIPGSDHLVFLRQPKVMADVIWSFLGD